MATESVLGLGQDGIPGAWVSHFNNGKHTLSGRSREKLSDAPLQSPWPYPKSHHLLSPLACPWSLPCLDLTPSSIRLLTRACPGWPPYLVLVHDNAGHGSKGLEVPRELGRIDTTWKTADKHAPKALGPACSSKLFKAAMLLACKVGIQAGPCNTHIKHVLLSRMLQQSTDCFNVHRGKSQTKRFRPLNIELRKLRPREPK